MSEGFEERYGLNKELAQMLKGGVIMDVTTPEQARIAEKAGACAVMALERIPADIRAPMITRVDDGVEVLCECGGVPVAVRRGGQLAMSFHPELTPDRGIHRYFLDMVG